MPKTILFDTPKLLPLLYQARDSWREKSLGHYHTVKLQVYSEMEKCQNRVRKLAFSNSNTFNKDFNIKM